MTTHQLLLRRSKPVLFYHFHSLPRRAIFRLFTIMRKKFLDSILCCPFYFHLSCPILLFDCNKFNIFVCNAFVHGSFHPLTSFQNCWFFSRPQESYYYHHCRSNELRSLHIKAVGRSATKHHQGADQDPIYSSARNDCTIR